MAYDSTRALLRQKLNDQIKALEQEFGPNSRTPQLVEARVSVWALEFADDPTPENLERLQQRVVSQDEQEADVPALQTYDTVPGQTSTQQPSTARLQVAGFDGNSHVFEDQRFVASAPVSARWTGNSISLDAAGNSFEDVYLVIEGTGTDDEVVSVTVSDLVGPGGATISNTSTDPTNKRDRPIKIRRPVYPTLRGVSWFAASYALQGSPPGPGYRESHRFGPWRSTDGSRTATSRPALGQSLPAYWMDCAWPEIGNSATVKGGGNHQFHLEVWFDSAMPAGDYTGTVTVTDADDGAYTVPITATRHAVNLSDAETHPYWIYLDAGYISDRVNPVTGDVGNRYPNESTPEADTRDDMTDLMCQLMRSCRLNPILPNMSSDAANAPAVPSLRHGSRLLGGIYDGASYLGPHVNQHLHTIVLGVYQSWRFWPGMGDVFAQESAPAQLSGYLDGFDAWVAANNFTGDLVAYLRDEPNTTEMLAQVQKWASWFAGRNYLNFTTPGSAHDTAATFEDMIALCPDVHMFMVNAGVMPTSTPADVAAFKAQGGTRKFGLYNLGAPMAHSHMVDDRIDGKIIDGLAQIKQGIYDADYYWAGANTINDEGEGVLTGLTEDPARPGYYLDEDGVLVYRLGSDGKGRPNFADTHFSFGMNASPDNRRATHGHAGHLYCEGDGFLGVCGQDGWFTDLPQVADAHPTTRLLMLRRRRQHEQLTRQALTNNNASATAALAALIPDGVYGYELGVQNDGLPNQARSYHEVDRLLDDIDSIDVENHRIAMLPLAA